MYGCLLIHSRKCSRACSFRFSSSRSSSFAFTRNLSDSIAAKLLYTQKWEMKRKKDEKLWNNQNSRTRRRLCRVGFQERPKTLKLCLAWFESIYAEKKLFENFVSNTLRVSINDHAALLCRCTARSVAARLSRARLQIYASQFLTRVF